MWMNLTKGYTGKLDRDAAGGLTLGSLLDAINVLRETKPDLYYVKARLMMRGKIFWIPDGDFNPGYFVCRTDEFDSLEKELELFFTLAPLKKYTPPEDCAEECWNSISESIQQVTTFISINAPLGEHVG